MSNDGEGVQIRDAATPELGLGLRFIALNEPGENLAEPHGGGQSAEIEAANPNLNTNTAAPTSTVDQNANEEAEPDKAEPTPSPNPSPVRAGT